MKNPLTLLTALTTILITTSSGCFFLDPYLRPEEFEQRARYQREYDMDEQYGKEHAYTPQYCVKVWFPRWAIDADRDNILATVDSYIDKMIEACPRFAEFPWHDKTWVYIHDAVSECIVSGGAWPQWVYGWRIGKLVVTPWRPVLNADGERVGVSLEDPFMVLPHEICHQLSQWETGDSDGDHNDFFVREDVKNMIRHARQNAKPCTLSPQSILQAMEYNYIPWIDPDDEE